MFKQRLGDHNRNKIIAIVAVFLFAAAASPASAGTLTPLSYTVSLSAFSNCETGSGGTCTALTNLANYTDTYPANPPFVNGSEATNSSQAVVSGAPCPGEGPCSPKDPTVSASARAGSGGTANANISYSYSFEAMGPGPSVIVDVAGYLLVGGTGDGGAWNSSASIMAYDSSGVKVGGLYLANPQDENPPPTLNFSKDLLISTDEVYTVILNVDAFADNGMGPGNYAYASVDPTITIDPTNVDADAYSLVFSDGLTTTPLPSSWFMLLSGLAGLVFFAYRGTKNGSAAIAAA